MSGIEPTLAPAWDALHELPRFRPAWPSESVVRFAARHLQPGSAVLDAGAGAGRHTAFLLGQGHRTTATDLSGSGLRHARSAVGDPDGAAFVHAKVQGLPFRTACFDGVVCHGVLMYTDAAGYQRGVDELRRVLRPGGWLFASVRTSDDMRRSLGPEVEPGTVRIESAETDEQGMLQHLLDRDGVDHVFGGFAELVVDRLDHTSGGGAIRNSDWLIEARR
jgi:SAM-dependent methyltransferase